MTSIATTGGGEGVQVPARASRLCYETILYHITPNAAERPKVESIRENQIYKLKRIKQGDLGDLAVVDGGGNLKGLPTASPWFKQMSMHVFLILAPRCPIGNVLRLRLSPGLCIALIFLLAKFQYQTCACLVENALCNKMQAISLFYR